MCQQCGGWCVSSARWCVCIGYLKIRLSYATEPTENRCVVAMESGGMSAQVYSKSFVPLESDPLVMNDLMYGLRVSKSLALTDVWSIDDMVQLSLITRPVCALILVLPTSEAYEKHRRAQVEVEENSKGTDIIWFRQTIDNACGLYAILHATCNSKAREFIGMPIWFKEGPLYWPWVVD